MGGEYAGDVGPPARPDRRRQRQEPEARSRSASLSPVPDARGRDRRGGDRARVRASAGRHPDGPAPPGSGRRGGCADAPGRAADVAYTGRGGDGSADSTPARTGCWTPALLATSSSPSTSMRSPTSFVGSARATRTDGSGTNGCRRRGCQHPPAHAGRHGWPAPRPRTFGEADADAPQRRWENGRRTR